MVLVAQACSLGCDAGSCVPCNSYANPILDSAVNAQSGMPYRHLVTSGSLAVGDWWNEDDNTIVGIGGVSLANLPSLSSLGTSQFSTTEIHGAQLSGVDFLYLDSSLEALDVSTPSMPVSLDTLAVTGLSYTSDMSVFGTVLSVAASDGIHVLDISNPASPAPLRVYAQSPGPTQVAMSGNYVAALVGKTVEVVNVSTATLVAQTTATSSPYAGTKLLQFDGTYVYVMSEYQVQYSGDYWAYGELDIYKLALAPTASLTFQGSLKQIDQPGSIWVDGTSLYVGTGDSVGVIDVSNPRAPAWKKHTAAPGGAAGLVVSGAYVVGAGATGFASYDPSVTPDVVITANGQDVLQQSAQVGSFAVLAYSSSGLVVVDWSNPSTPQPIYSSGEQASGVAVAGHYAYVTVATATADNLETYDITDPWAPALVGTVQVSTNEFTIGTVAVADGRLYVTWGGGGSTNAYSLANPKAPTLIAPLGFPLPGSPSSLAYQGKYIYGASYETFTVMDGTNPASPTQVASVALPSGDVQGTGLVVAGNYAYVVIACQYASVCVEVVDITAPTSPTVVGSATLASLYMSELEQTLDGDASVSSVALVGSRLYVSAEWGGIYAFDVSNPSKPIGLTDYWTQLPAAAMYGMDNTLIATTWAAFDYPGTGFQDQTFQMCQ